MAVLQFGFDPDPHSPHHLGATTASTRSSTRARTTTTRVARLVRRRSPASARAEVDAAIAHGVARRAALVADRLAFSSPARLAMVQAQDVLGLGSEARMNMPGTAERRVAVAAARAAR